VTAALDDLALLRRWDASGMAGRVGELPRQIRDGWAQTRRLTLPQAYRDATEIVVLGLGGSAIGADLVRTVFADRLRAPMLVVRDYDVPAFVRPSTLVVASSHSGATEETVSATDQALARGSSLAVIATGGPLVERATTDALPLLRFDPEPQPRLAVGWGVVLLAGLLERAGLMELSDDEVEEAASRAEQRYAGCAPDVPTERNAAKQLAFAAVDRLAVVVGSGHLSAVARRWKTQLNENAKSWAAFDEMPEATHNTVAGLREPDTLREHLFVALLGSADYHPRNTVRLELLGDLLEQAETPATHVEAEGRGRLAQAFDLIVLGDLVSVYLACLYGLDPTPVDVIVKVKERLSGA
jgi:glucose/mannose-6-phosphate isomerase